MNMDHPRIENYAKACASEFAKTPFVRGLESEQTSINALVLGHNLFLTLKIYNAVFHEEQAESVFKAMCSISQEDTHALYDFMQEYPWTAALAAYAAFDVKIFPTDEERHAIELKNIALKVIADNLFLEQEKINQLKAKMNPTDEDRLELAQSEFFIEITQKLHELDKIMIASHVSGLPRNDTYRSLPNQYLDVLKAPSFERHATSRDIYDQYIQVMPFERKDFERTMRDCGAMKFEVQPYLRDQTLAKPFHEGWMLPDKTVVLKSESGQLAFLNEEASQSLLNIQVRHAVNDIQMLDGNKIKAINNGHEHSLFEGIKHFFGLESKRTRDDAIQPNNFNQGISPPLSLSEMHKLSAGSRVSDETQAGRQDFAHHLTDRLERDMQRSVQSLSAHEAQDLQKVMSIFDAHQDHDMKIMIELSKPENISILSSALKMSEDKIAYYVTHNLEDMKSSLQQAYTQNFEAQFNS